MTQRPIPCIDRALKFSKSARMVLVAAVVGVFSLLPASVANAASEQQSAALKPAPVAPKDTPNGVTAPVANKGAAQLAHPNTAALAYTASISATSTNLWPQQYSTITATTNQDVGPTPYYLSIYDATANSYIKVCPSGTTCSIAVTFPTATTHVYRSYVSYYPLVVPQVTPPAGTQAVSGNLSITWRSISVSLAASPTTVGINGTSTLTATASADVTPSPFYIQIYDATTGTRLNYCGFSATCSVPVSKAFATTHRYIAYVSNYGAAYPPAGIQATSNSSYVTWTASNYRLSLGSTTPSFGHRTLTAYSNINVLPTPYYIQIFNLRTGTRIAVCGSGTTCSVTVSLAFGKTDFVAFTSAYSTTIPPLNTQASSNVVSASYPIIISPLEKQE